MLDIQRPPFHFACIVDGRPVERDERIVVRYPFTGEVIGSVPNLDPDEVARAIRLGASSPPRLSRHERNQVLLRAAARIEGEADRVARLITWESGLCLKDTRHEVLRTLDVLRF